MSSFNIQKKPQSFMNKASATDTNSTWQCGLYLRLSREDGDKLESDSITNQRKIIDKFIDKNPELNVFDTYIDDGYSGTNFDRPEMIRLLNDIKSRKVNCIIIKDLSRFGRNYHEVGQYLEVVFPLLQLRVIAINDNIDSYKNPISIRNASVAFKNVMNDEYGRDISNKVRSVFDMKRKRGDFIGSFATYGYIKDPQNRHKIIVDQEAACIVKQIFSMYLEGLSIYNICRALYNQGVLTPTEYKKSKGFNINNKSLSSKKNEWCKRTVQRMLQNRMYIGDMVQKKCENISYKVQVCRQLPKEKYIIKVDNHEPIIDIQTFEKVQEMFKRHIRHTKRDCFENSQSINIFAGFIKCADCKRAMTRHRVTNKYNKTYYYFSCTTYRKWRQCSKHSIRVDIVENVILQVLQKQIELAIEMDSMLQIINRSSQRNINTARISKAIENLQAERVRQKRCLNDLYPDFKSELITKEQYLQFRDEYQSRLNEIDNKLLVLTEQKCSEEQGVDSSNDFISNFKQYKNITKLTSQAINSLINMVYIEDNGGIKIEFNFKDAFEQVIGYIDTNIEIIHNSAKNA